MTRDFEENTLAFSGSLLRLRLKDNKLGDKDNGDTVDEDNDGLGNDLEADLDEVMDDEIRVGDTDIVIQINIKQTPRTTKLSQQVNTEYAV